MLIFGQYGLVELIFKHIRRMLQSLIVSSVLKLCLYGRLSSKRLTKILLMTRLQLFCIKDTVVDSKPSNLICKNT